MWKFDNDIATFYAASRNVNVMLNLAVQLGGFGDLPRPEAVMARVMTSPRIATQRPDPALLIEDPDCYDKMAVAAVLAGDTEAFALLIEVYEKRIYNLAYRLLGQAEEAQDASQDAFLNAYTRLRSYDASLRFRSWLFTIANNLCIDRLRRRRIEPATFAEFEPLIGSDDDRFSDVPESSPGPEQHAIIKERMRAVHGMLRTLAPVDRSMVVLAYWGDLSYDEIAGMHKTTVSAVKSRLFRAKRAMAGMQAAANLL